MYIIKSWWYLYNISKGFFKRSLHDTRTEMTEIKPKKTVSKVKARAREEEKTAQQKSETLIC